MSGMAAERAQRRLLRALSPALEPFTLLAARSTDWASATFVGARHRIAVRIDGDAAAARAAALAAALPDQEFAVPGALVADLAVALDDRAGGAALGIEVLLIDDDAPGRGAISPPRGAPPAD